MLQIAAGLRLIEGSFASMIFLNRKQNEKDSLLSFITAIDVQL